MARSRRRKKSAKSPRRSTPTSRRARYSPTEIFLAALGAAIVILFAGILITSLLG